jgi:hypothetical protein
LAGLDPQEEHTMSILSPRKLLSSTMFAAAILCASGAAILTASSPAAAQPKQNYSYGGVKFFAPAYTFKGTNGQSGNVVFFRAPPRTMPGHNGQVGNVTYLGGVRPYTMPSHSGQYGNTTYLGNRPAFAVPVRTIPTPNIVPIRR